MTEPSPLTRRRLGHGAALLSGLLPVLSLAPFNLWPLAMKYLSKQLRKKI